MDRRKAIKIQSSTVWRWQHLPRYFGIGWHTWGFQMISASWNWMNLAWDGVIWQAFFEQMSFQARDRDDLSQVSLNRTFLCWQVVFSLSRAIPAGALVDADASWCCTMMKKGLVCYFSAHPNRLNTSEVAGVESCPASLDIQTRGWLFDQLLDIQLIVHEWKQD